MEESVLKAFCDRYTFEAQHLAVAPGRVNLIGEHIDYEGYAVLPMALEQACAVAAGRRPSSNTSGGAALTVSNVDAAAYPPASFELGPGGAPPDVGSCARWHRYVLAAAHGAWEHLAAAAAAGSSGGGPAGGGGPTGAAAAAVNGGGGFAGVCLMVGSNIPPGSGLSSSSALVVASALALLAAAGARPPPSEVADLARRCERLVGTMGGGMDQAISLMAQPGRAMLIDWAPLRASPVALPPGAAFVVANCMAPSLKAETADRRFNLRVVECRLAAALLARKLGAPPEAAAAVRTLREVEPRVAAAYGPGLEGKLKAVNELLPPGSCLQPQLEAELGVALAALFDGDARALRVLGAVRGEGFRLRDRAAHVYSETDRVLRFRAVAEDAASAAGDGDALEQLGALMDASHASCRDLYECSCAELDELVAQARAAGALGARLTGAGWGGCVVALAREEAARELLQRLEAGYYRATGRLGPEEASSHHLFATRPAAGARVISGEQLRALLGAAQAAV